jgi:hypothetical protein
MVEEKPQQDLAFLSRWLVPGEWAVEKAAEARPALRALLVLSTFRGQYYGEARPEGLLSAVKR